MHTYIPNLKQDSYKHVLVFQAVIVNCSGAYYVSVTDMTVHYYYECVYIRAENDSTPFSRFCLYSGTPSIPDTHGIKCSMGCAHFIGGSAL